MTFATTALARIVGGAVSSGQSLLLILGLLIWDLGLTLLNLLLPALPPNGVVPAGKAGAGGLWPTYIPPSTEDSRCSCPALNAMANHDTYNFAPTFCIFVPHTMAEILDRSYWTDRFDLSDIDVHNGIEHDASLTREEAYFEPDQSKVSVKLVEEMLRSGTGPQGDLTIADLSRVSERRRAEAKRTNPQFSLSFSHKMFGSSNSSTMLTTFGGKVADLRSWLVHGRIPEGWQPKTNARMGVSILQFNATVFQVELGINEPNDGTRKNARTAKRV
ncbi:hypothetical protein EIP91_002281 [Steccherinum ochraceum]|uniref:Heme haloperoxidase family profile domain-containing protein n=1 Tax=Steccherinum ochraceum TaxID=92696 RepID=A0A4R0RIQ3_9APHY|nr:hypothetical protein EIP91_002281 [Steccherinum ochraceum]